MYTFRIATYVLWLYHYVDICGCSCFEFFCCQFFYHSSPAALAIQEIACFAPSNHIFKFVCTLSGFCGLGACACR